MREPPSARDTSLHEASYAAFNNGDVEALLALYTEDCVWDVSRFRGGEVAGLNQVFRGHDGLREFLAEFRAMVEPWGGARTEFEQIFELGEDRVWIRGKLRFGSPSGDAELFDHFSQLVRTCEGKISEVVTYWDPEEARRDAGLDAVPEP